MTITLEWALKLIESTNGKMFSVTFTKKDGTLRDMVCRMGVKKYVNGKGMAYDPSEYELIPVYDVTKNEYRMINSNTIQRVKVYGNEYRVV